MQPETCRSRTFLRKWMAAMISRQQKADSK